MIVAGLFSLRPAFFLYSALAIANRLITMTCRLLAVHAIFGNGCCICAERDPYTQWSSFFWNKGTSESPKPNGFSRSLIKCSINCFGSYPFWDRPKYLYHMVGYVLINSQLLSGFTIYIDINTVFPSDWIQYNCLVYSHFSIFFPVKIPNSNGTGFQVAATTTAWPAGKEVDAWLAGKWLKSNGTSKSLRNGWCL